MHFPQIQGGLGDIFALQSGVMSHENCSDSVKITCPKTKTLTTQSSSNQWLHVDSVAFLILIPYCFINSMTSLTISASNGHVFLARFSNEHIGQFYFSVSFSKSWLFVFLSSEQFIQIPLWESPSSKRTTTRDTSKCTCCPCASMVFVFGFRSDSLFPIAFLYLSLCIMF